MPQNSATDNEKVPKGSAETAALTKGCADDAVVATTSKKAPQTVNDFEPSEVLSTHRPYPTAVEQNRPDQGLIDATFGLERNLSSGPQCGFQADFVFSLIRCRKGRAQILEGLDLLQEYATEVDSVLCPGTWR